MCHFVYGLGYGDDDLIVYESLAGKYFETKGGKFRMTPEQIREATKTFLQNSPREEHSQISIFGEMCAQIAELSKQLALMVSYLSAIEHNLSLSTVPHRSSYGDDMESPDPVTSQAESVDENG
jgi:hypothetical protein